MCREELHVAHIRSLVHAIYAFHNPTKLNQLDQMMEQWAGEEEDLLVEVQKKYGPSDAWARAPQPTDLASQQRVLIAAYGEWDDSKSAEDVLGIIDKRRGEEPELPEEEWRLLCAKLKEKYGQHPLEVATQAGQGVEG